MEFPSRGTEYINRMRKFLGSIQKEVEFAGGNPEEIMYIANYVEFHGSWKFQ